MQLFTVYGNRLLLITGYLVFFTLLIPEAARSQQVTFEGEKSTWHEGFDRYDFMMDEATLAITPYKAPSGEGLGVKDPPNGHRRCIVIVPKKFAPGNPWTWRGCYWDHQPQAEIEMLRRGFCVAYISANATLKPGKEWDAWYKFLVAHNLSGKPCFIGMSRGGEYSYMWATTHPDKISAIYVDNPGGNYANLLGMGELARYDVPILHVCGSIDPILGQYSTAYENIYKEFGGRISVMIKEGFGHHPHSLKDPKPIADFLEQSVYETKPATPAYITKPKGRISYYSTANIYKYVPAEGTYINFRGPYFTGCYNQYELDVSGVEAFATVVEPNKPAPGNPWVYRSGFLKRDAAVDQALLAKGYYIVTGPSPYGADGPQLKEWNLVYQHLIENGFSKKPVMQGEGEAAGEVIAWAIGNPDKVSAIYAENPILKSKLMIKTPLIDNLSVLAKAAVPILFISGKLDPSYNDETLVAQKRYKQMGGKITVITIPDGEHYLSIKDTRPPVNFIESTTK
jgi:pimeloyl-ACP methyl ester carboxylesterase